MWMKYNFLNKSRKWKQKFQLMQNRESAFTFTVLCKIMFIVDLSESKNGNKNCAESSSTIPNLWNTEKGRKTQTAEALNASENENQNQILVKTWHSLELSLTKLDWR